jgi:hypothetical protein
MEEQKHDKAAKVGTKIGEAYKSVKGIEVAKPAGKYAGKLAAKLAKPLTNLIAGVKEGWKE